jgi:hypothetical protein
MIHQDSNNFSYYESLDEIKADGLTPVSVNNLLQFFTLRGKTSPDISNKIKQEAIEYARINDVTVITGTRHMRIKYGLYEKENSTDLAKENLEPLVCNYVVHTKAENGIYYLRTYSGRWSVDTLYFMRKSLDFSGDDVPMETFQRYVFDDRVWMLLTQEQVDETKKMLDRVRKANVKTGVLDYRTYITILEAEIRLEEYRVCYSSGMGFRTGCKLQEDNVRNMWLKVAKKPPKA